MQPVTQAVIPDIMTYLENLYRKETKQANGVLISTDVAHFINWCKQHLNKNRPYELFIVTDNYGIKLTNSDSFTISTQQTDISPRGAMANPDTSISI